MTAITHQATHRDRRSTLSSPARAMAAGALAAARRLRATMAAVVAAGQLGPDAETERGRWTGARV